ncbi:MAG: carboxypeptidase regulatory-like domain-containing protein, partial [Sphingobacteriales bacterium]
MKNIYIVALLCALVLGSFYSMAQETSGALSGQVKDAKGEVVPGASVVAIHTPTGTRYGIAADVDGRYFLNNLRIGAGYTVTASLTGMKSEVRENIDVRLGGSQRLD